MISFLKNINNFSYFIFLTIWAYISGSTTQNVLRLMSFLHLSNTLVTMKLSELDSDKS